jgi:DNA-binding SARP family transcriptional activator
LGYRCDVLRARLFGALSAEVDGRFVPVVPGFKARSLFAYLLVHPGPHPRVRLAGLFWPDMPDTRARASLRVALFALRRTLESAGGSGYLVTDRFSAGLAADLPRDIDVERFDELLAGADPAALAEAAALYRGPLLSDLPDEWVLEAQDDYRLRVAGACEQLGDHAQQAGDLAAAADWARRAVGFEPLRESGHRALISRLSEAGRPAEALAAYRKCAAVIFAELGVEPSAEIQELGRRLGAAGGPRRSPVRKVRSRPASPLVGRARELATAQGWWRAAADGAPHRFALVTGEAGIGKTRLVTELTAWVEAAGGRHAMGTGLELSGGPPFAPWSEVLRELVRQCPAPPQSAEWPAVLARLAPVVTAHWGRSACPPSPAPELERARLFEAVAESLAWSGRDRPLLIVLDDLHLADAASVTLLAYLGRRLPELRALVVGTRRPIPASPRLDAALERLDRGGVMAAELLLSPLSAKAVRAIAVGAVPALRGTDVERVVAGSDGNPLLARQTARAVSQGEEPSAGLRQMVRAPLGRLSPAARLLVDMATAAARPLRLAEAADLMGADTLADALEAEFLGELLDLSGDDRIRFAHSLLRDACYQELPGARRTRLHARIAETFARRPDRSAAEVAQHHQLAGDRTAAGAYLMVAAGDARSLGALGDAAALLREAAELVAGDRAREAEAWQALADVEAWRGNRTEWEAASDRGCELLEELGDTLALAEAHASRGRWLHTTLCYPRESLAAYRQALRLLDDSGLDAPEVRALALAGAAWAEATAGDPAAVEDLAAAAESFQEITGDRSLVADLASARATTLLRLGHVAQGEALFEEAAIRTAMDGRSDLAVVLWINSAAAAACRGEFRKSLEYARQGEDCKSGGPYFDLLAVAGQAYALSRLGEHGQAMAAAQRLTAIAIRSGVAEFEVMSDFDAGALAFAAGDDEQAIRRLGAALSVPGTRYFSRPVARLLLAEARLRGGDPAGADRELDLIPAEPVTAADLPDTLVARLVRIEGLLASERGDRQLALTRFAEAESAWRRRLGPDGVPGDAFAMNMVDLGRPAVAGLIEPVVELGRVLADRALVLREAGRHAEASAAAAEAAELADAAAFTGYRSQLDIAVSGA